MKLNILIVDDDQYFRMGVKSAINDFGIITEAKSAKEALSLISHHHYDLALIDMQMQEDTSGLSVLQRATSKNIHSIILSSYENNEVIKKAYELGCHHFLAKINYNTSLPSYLTHFIKNIKKKIKQKLTT